MTPSVRAPRLIPFVAACLFLPGCGGGDGGAGDGASTGSSGTDGANPATDDEGSTPSAPGEDSDTASADSSGSTTGSSETNDEDGSSGSDGAVCRGVNEAPASPALLSPEVPSNGILAVDTGLALSASAFDDPDGGGHAASTFEIWEMSGGGDARIRVWSATLESGDLTGATLEDGTFDDAKTDALDLWTRYGIRVQYRDDDAACPLWSEWSDWLELRSDDGSDALFDPTAIHDVYITIPPESWDPINLEARPPGCTPFERSYHRGSVQFDDEEFDINVGVRSKGGCGSSRYLHEKTAFKVNLEWDDPDVAGCAPDQRLFGQKKLTLNNMVQDASYSKEMIGYPFYRAMGIAVPRVAYVRVYVNDEYWGPYLHVETVTRRFLRRWYADNSGVLYEGTYGCDLDTDLVPPTQAEYECFDQKFQPDLCDQPDFEPALNHAALLDLTSAIDAMAPGQFYPAIEQYVDFDQFLRLWAADSMLNNWDGFVVSANNYRIYLDPSTDLWSVLPGGIDQILEGGALSPFEYGTRMAERCLEEPLCTEAFAEQLQIAFDLFESTPFQDRLDDNYELISELALADPRGENLDYFEEAYNVLYQWISFRPTQVAQEMADAGF